MMEYQGVLSKLSSELAQPIIYHLPLSDQLIPLNPYIGQMLRLEFMGEIRCQHCNRETKKSFQQGYCFPCMRSLARCDLCIVKPERCHYAQGTCREPAWGEAHCLRPHIIYLADTSHAKVGITRQTQLPTRWIDQGALQALPIFSVSSRYYSGLLEVALAEYLSDKTHWQRMLKAKQASIDLLTIKQKLLANAEKAISYYQRTWPAGSLESLAEDIQPLDYPVIEYPEKIIALNLDRTPLIQGRLLGIKGQYLLLDSGVFNIRKFSGYTVRLGLG